MEKDKRSTDQPIVDKFLEDFARRLSVACDIDFILLFGSAARGDWKKGVSDVDMIIQAVNSADKDEVYRVAEDLFWELDDKYGTEFKKVCSIGVEETDSALDKIIKKGQSTARLYAPFEVLCPGDVDWERGELKSGFLKLGTDLVAPKYLLFTKMKVEGKIIYGRNIIQDINPQVNWFDRVKAILVPHHLSLFSVLTSPFSPEIAVKMSIKSAIYSVESCIYYLKKPVGRGIGSAMADLEEEIGQNRWVDICHIRRLYELKYSSRLGEKFSKVCALSISLKTFIMVVKLNWWTVVHRLKGKLAMRQRK